MNYMTEDFDSEDLILMAKHIGVTLIQCGGNSDWPGYAWHVNAGLCNRITGDLYLVDSEAGELHLVQRVYEGDPRYGRDYNFDEGGVRTLSEVAITSVDEFTLYTMLKGAQDVTGVVVDNLHFPVSAL